MYGTSEFDLVDHYTGAPAFHHIFDYPNEAMLHFTRSLGIIDFITYSSRWSTNTKWNRTLTNTPRLLTSAFFSIPFDYFASVGEIVLFECLKRRPLNTLPRWLSCILTTWWHNVSLLCKLLHIVYLPLYNPVYPWSHDVRSAHQAMQDSHLCHSRELVQITRSVIITTWSSVQ